MIVKTEAVIIELAEWQLESIAVLGVMVFFVLGWAVFGWSK